MLRWYWYLCGSVYARQTALLGHREIEDYEIWNRTLPVPNARDRSGSSGTVPEYSRVTSRHARRS
jgi:hypothetical protein